LPNGYSLRFAAEGDVLAEIARTVDNERKCCRFLRFAVTVEPDNGPITVDLTAFRRTFASAFAIPYASQRGIERALHGMAARRPVAAEIGTAGRPLSEPVRSLLRRL
jgi:hypothetical protein